MRKINITLSKVLDEDNNWELVLCPWQAKNDLACTSQCAAFEIKKERFATCGGPQRDYVFVYCNMGKFYVGELESTNV